MESYDNIKEALKHAYDQSASHRDRPRELQPWKQSARAHFLAWIQQEKKSSLLEVGAGPGTHGLFFQENGLRVVSTDNSPEMVALAKAKGLEAYERDFLGLGLPAGSFDTIFALNCLLHVPKSEWPAVLEALKYVLDDEGLLYIGVYGGSNFERVDDNDWHDPPRFFAQFTNDAIQELVGRHFEIVYFGTVFLHDGPDFNCHQSLIVRK